MNIGRYFSSLKHACSLSSVLLVAYVIFIAGFFLVPAAFEDYHQDFFYVVLAVIGLPIVPKGIRILQTNPLFIILTMYLLYMVMSGLWTDVPYGDGGTAKQMLSNMKRVLYILFFFVLTAAVREAHPQGFEFSLKLLSVVASVSAVLTLLIWYHDNPFPSRPFGFTVIRWTIFTAYVYGAFCVISASCFVRAKSMHARAIYALATLILFAYVLLSQSRMALGAVAVGLLVVSFGLHIRKGIVLTLLAGTLGLVAIAAAVPDVYAYLFERGLSYRPAIWGVYIERALEALVVGEGYHSDPRLYVEFPGLVGYVPDAHSGYLGTLRDGGLIGLLLLIGAFGVALWQSFRTVLRSGNYLAMALLLHLMACILTDTDRLITRIGALWLFIWFPLALIMTEALARPRGKSKVDSGCV